MIKAYKGIIPDEQDQHDPELKDIDGNTVAMLLAQNKIIPPQQWQHDPNIKNSKGQTVFSICVDNGLIPPKYFCKDPNYQDKYGDTQAMILAENNIKVPEYLYHDPNIQNEYGYTVAMLIVLYCNQLPPKEWYHQPELQNIYGWTVAMYIARYCKQVPPNIWLHNPAIKNNKGNTVAMILLQHNQDIPECWYHSSEIQNNDGYTVALLYASKGLVPPKEWHHNRFIRVEHYNEKYHKRQYYTVQNFLKQNNIEVLEQWKYDNIVDEDENTQVMIQARDGYIPYKSQYDNPRQTNMNKETVASILASKGIIPPKQWKCNKFIKYMYFDEIYDGYNDYTIAEILSKQGIVAPKQWMISENENKQIFNNIRYNLKKFGYEYINRKFVFNCQTEILNDICQICLSEGEQQFIKSKCGHKICLDCFKQFKKQKQHKLCPFCRQYDWYEKIIEDYNYDYNYDDIYDNEIS